MIQGEKHLYKKHEIRYVQVPQYEELSVKNIYPLMKKDALFMSYFPDKYAKGKGPPRDYFFNILNTQQPDYLNQIMDHAAKQRMSADGLMQKDQTIKMTEYWEEQLKAMPYLTRKC